MADLNNHPGFWLNAQAAASLERYEADRGVTDLNSAGRHEWEQQEFIDRWDRGGWQNRPPYLYNPMRPAWKGAHVKDGGNAIDLSNWREFLKNCDEYGWVQTYAWDVVHFEYFASRDKHRNRPATGGNNIPAGEEEDDMAITIIQKKDSNAAKSLYDVKAGRAVRPISKDENSGFRAAGSPAVIYVTLSDGEYAQRGGF